MALLKIRKLYQLNKVIDQFHRPLRDLRISVIDRCNFRCPYCMPAEHFQEHYRFMAKQEWLSFDEIERLAKIFVSLGVSKIRLTGGEPLLRPDLPKLVDRLNRIEGVKDLALTTNGSYLGVFASDLKLSGLKRLTVSLDAIHAKTFRQMSGDRGDLHVVLKSLEIAKSHGFENIKLNCVIKRGINDHAFLDLVEFARQNGHTLRFIEYMDVGNQNHWDLAQVVPSQEILKKIEGRYPLEAIGGTEDGETSERYRFLDGQGQIGFVSSVSHPFCGTCNRLRLSADGKMYTCLFATEGTDLLTSLRNGVNDDSLKELILAVWRKRQDRYSELRSQIQKDNSSIHKVEMYHIGG